MRSSRAAVPLRRCKASSSGQAKMTLCPSTIRKLSGIPGRGYLENRGAASELRSGRRLSAIRRRPTPHHGAEFDILIRGNLHIPYLERLMPKLFQRQTGNGNDKG